MALEAGLGGSEIVLAFLKLPPLILSERQRADGFPGISGVSLVLLSIEFS